MNAIISIVKRHPLAAFFILAYTFSWLPWVLGTLIPASRPFVLYPFVSGGPLLAALVVIPITQGRTGLRALGASLLKWRVGWRWYAVALGLPLVVALGAMALNVAFGAPVPALDQPGPWYMPFLAFAVRLINPSDGPLGEEPGWRGFAQPGLQAKRSPLTATLFFALLVAGWHLPLVLASDIDQLPPIGLLATIGVTFWYAWLYNRSRGSVLMTLMAHAAEGVFLSVAMAGFAGAHVMQLFWLYSALWCVAAVGLVLFDRSVWRARKPVAPASVEAIPGIS
jgi:membrane protease YdiL (CAAX protease family)